MNPIGLVTFSFGAVLLVAGMLVYLRHVKVCKRIVEATSNHAGGLQEFEISDQNLRESKQLKLRSLLETQPIDSELRALAASALALQMTYRCLLVPGWLLFFCGTVVSTIF